LELDPHSMIAHFVLGQAYVARSQTEEGLAALRTAVELSSRLPWIVATLGEALASLGQLEPARQILQELSTRSDHEYVPARLFALLQAHLGDMDAAFQWFEKAREERDPLLPLILTFRSKALLAFSPPEWIRNDPRWVAFNERVGVKR